MSYICNQNLCFFFLNNLRYVQILNEKVVILVKCLILCEMSKNLLQYLQLCRLSAKQLGLPKLLKKKVEKSKYTKVVLLFNCEHQILFDVSNMVMKCTQKI